jgi:L-amino acid N-acyltransferase YncA
MRPRRSRRIVVLDMATRRLAAYAAAWQWKVPERRYRMDLPVHPVYRNRGSGALLLDSLVNEITPEGVKTLQARVRADELQALAFPGTRRPIC